MNNLVKSEGAIVLAEIDSLLPRLLAAEMTLTKARTQIGILLNEVRAKHYWKEKGFDSFGAYIESLEAQFNRGRTTLYAFAGLARDLLPEVSEDQLSAMGFEKAKLVRAAKKSTGQLPAANILDMAADDSVTTKQFRQALLDNKKLPDTVQDGKFYSLEYFATKEQQETIQAAIVAAKREFGGDGKMIGADEVLNGLILEIMAQEYLGAHSGAL